MVNTKAADVWALGALVHFLAVGTPPIVHVDLFKKGVRKLYGGEDPPEASQYSHPSQYYYARARRYVTPINYTQHQQRGYRIVPHMHPECYQTYSNPLDNWMRCALSPLDMRVTTETLLKKMVPQAKAILRELSGPNGLVDLEFESGEYHYSESTWYG